MDTAVEARAYQAGQDIHVNLVERERRASPRPYGTRKSNWGAVPGFHPGLFSILPSGKRSESNGALEGRRGVED